MKLSMMVVMTSCAPVRALRRPAIPAQMAPPMMAAASASRMWSTVGGEMLKPTQRAAMPPMSICPLTPMLNNPA